ncbi:MAG: bifunctional folylpolyglutamate synthase/dihydrofolate synthase, partial [Verrucomicrobiae bacterium]|nr:bifunctional folylpolyglutamate synthase/dihydrofolate synthase [Verrucomicrobiae bacterium]
QRYGIQPGLQTTRELLAALGNPHERLRFIHIAGTNGKGSVAAMCHSVLSTAGYRTGLYTSPHLVSFCERIQVDGRAIAETDLAELVADVQQLLGRTVRPPTLFEVTTVLALRYFEKCGTDIVILETGMGGRLDATNVVKPLVSVVTNVGFDHMEYLGDTLAKIAAEKAGIIKAGIPVVTAATGEALEVIRKVAEQRRAPLIVVTDGVNRTPLKGPHQAINCAVAEAALRASGLRISEEQMARGLASTRWPGRFDIVRREPLLILDGAHNPDGARALASAVQAEFPGRKFTLILGVLADKDYAGICRELVPLAERILCVPVPSPRTATAEELARACRPAETEVCHDVYEAIEKTRNVDTLLAGSLYLVGAAMAHLQRASVADQVRWAQ